METLFNVEALISVYGYAGIFLIVFLESGIFFALPGDSLLFTAGLIATTGYLNIFYLIPLIFVSTFFGGILGYYVGVYLEKLRRFSVFRKIFKDEYVNKTYIFLEKYGHIAIVFSRFVPVVRTFMPMVAGIAQMNLWKYLRYNFLGSLVWSTGVTLVGYFLGSLFPNLKNHLEWLVIFTILVSCLPLLASIWQKLRPGKGKAK
ncbi:MAG: DedA family protein [Candidatus Paceibacterota bacterium]